MGDYYQYDVFISHASVDKAVVRPVVSRLQDEGLKVWFDESDLRDGQSIPAKIDKALDTSRVVVFCLSADALKSAWVMTEVDTVRMRDPRNTQGQLVILALDGSEPPGTLVTFKRIQWNPSKDDPSHGRLVAACRKVSPEPNAAQNTSTTPKPNEVIQNEFGVDLDVLERVYVEPNLQDTNPPDEANHPGQVASSEGVSQWFNRFLLRDITDESGARILFILADAGMGKTSLLLRLKGRDLASPLRDGYSCELMKLGQDTLPRIAAITDPVHTLLLLDSLDEDPEAHRYEDGATGRLRQLLPRLKPFFRVVITCRTQFFPETSPHLTDRPGWFSMSDYSCPLKYLSLFNDDQVETYLQRKFPPSILESVLKRFNWGGRADRLESARTAAKALDSLRMRPLLLSYIEDFVEGEEAQRIDHRNRYDVYQHLVTKWLQRERENNKHLGLNLEEGWKVATALAVHLTQTDRRRLPQVELSKVPGLETFAQFKIEARSLLNRTTQFEFQFAHSTFQEFLVARALLKGEFSFAKSQCQATSVTRRFIIDGLPKAKASAVDLRGVGLVLDPIWKGWVKDQLGIEMVWVPPGTFLMGSPDDERGRSDDEGPRHSVTLTSGYWLGRFPVTQDQFQRVTGSNPSYFKGGSRPVESLTWHEAVTYCDALNQAAHSRGLLPEDWRFRLPTEAEWEYACRAGTASAFNDGSSCTAPTGNDPALRQLGWFQENSKRQTHPVGEKSANAWGIHDMHGNVWEWCLDGHRTYGDRPEVNPVGRLDGARRVLRGGSCWFNARFCRSAFRFGSDPGNRDDSIGFRLAAGQVIGPAAGQPAG